MTELTDQQTIEATQNLVYRAYGIMLLNNFLDWAFNCEISTLMEFYQSTESYAIEKMKVLLENPLRWWGSLDIQNQRRFIKLLHEYKAKR